MCGKLGYVYIKLRFRVIAITLLVGKQGEGSACGGKKIVRIQTQP